MTEPRSFGPSIWAVSDGRAGNAAQVRSIVNALTETQRWMRIAHINGEGHRTDPLDLHPRPPLVWLPSSAWVWPKLALPADERQALSAPWPTVMIAAGRRSAPYTAKVREWSAGQTTCIQILDPRMSPDAFDLLVTPAHDEVTGDNVIRTAGSPSYFSSDAIEEAGLAFADLADERGKSCIVILGGDSRTHKFTPAAAERIVAKLRQLAGEGWRLRITTSRRTPADAIALIKGVADQVGARIWTGPEDGPNPYLAWLIFSDAAIVTEDSANMLSDAAYHGLPVHMARLSGKSAKFDRLHQSLIDHGAARWLGETLESWSYEPLREADRVADAIVEALLKRHPQPAMPPAGDGTVIAPDWL
ncbi:MAG: mitochondrial fission ELM1 family protein [Pseudomonadota bacterium]